MDGKKISIAIPTSVVSDTPHLREKTSKIGLIGRAAAIFKVDEIVVYPDNPETNQRYEIDLITTLLAYMETPQYLRKRLFKLKPTLRYAGILPPLRTLHHPLNRKMKDLKIGEYREGVTLSSREDGTLIDIGVEKPALIQNRQLSKGKRTTVKITKINEQVQVDLASREEIPHYWGYTITTETQPFVKMLKSRNFDLTIATSKYGTPFADAAEEISERWKSAQKILLAFGAPTQGLYEIVKHEGFNLDDMADFIINTIPTQGTETVRTEEALIASLAILNAHFRF